MKWTDPNNNNNNNNGGGSVLSLVQILFSFVFEYGNVCLMSIKQRKVKFEPGIKLNHNIYKFKGNTAHKQT